ncbi:hypothetical protein Sjap_015424 [Stephania japonica]|uniref:Uncharacterized protein n=1 Tax=Stephania japonica TaxID=461633 RepID=A0AAP0IL05_9MAGN
MAREDTATTKNYWRYKVSDSIEEFESSCTPGDRVYGGSVDCYLEIVVVKGSSVVEIVMGAMLEVIGVISLMNEAKEWRKKSFPFYNDCCVIFENDRATGEDAVAAEDAIEEVEIFNSSSDNDFEVVRTTEMPYAIEEVEMTSTTSRSRTTTHDGNGNPYKKKNKVSGYTYLGNQMVVAAQVVASEISKLFDALRMEHSMHTSFLAAMGEVNELNDVEKAIYGSKIMRRVEHMAVFLNLKPELRYNWVHAMFD